jgi:hypothetical protein
MPPDQPLEIQSILKIHIPLYDFQCIFQVHLFCLQTYSLMKVTNEVNSMFYFEDGENSYLESYWLCVMNT